ncbi:hypothetical protein H8K52_04640 [Undibacterium seohonense]|uniref:Lanthionine synthetase-like protein n=1 Tax=Undibacterium seohonense TaxID=1344950 RepID=A0ABR6X150_9BURK|nr:lanthionine synthetase LanC family protein [Undibacterium seohonense]MBC3806632.1 hypothetical protein [Undibacterium seohonense]
MVTFTNAAHAVQQPSLPNSLYLEVADRIANRLCRDAIWDKDRCNWLGWGMEYSQQRRSAVYQACGSELYGGTIGIALFLAELLKYTGDRQQLRCLEGAVNQAWSMHAKRSPSLRHSFYSGSCGIAFAMTRIGELLQRERLIERGMTLMLELRDVPIDKKNIDVIGGSAGAIPALLLLAKKYSEASLLDLACAHGQHLLGLAEQNPMGASWATITSPVKANLTGFAHGTAGIATALVSLYQATGDQSYLLQAESALQYEKQWFHEDESNWEDLRQTGHANQSCSMGWCHGAPGIGLSRLRLLQLQPLLPNRPTISQDLEAALASTSRALMKPWAPGMNNYSLCHGAAGNAELMILAGQYLQRPDLSAVAEKVGQDGYDFYVKQGLPWPCGNSGAGESPNLMLGMAGIGHFYLRLYDPLQVASVLSIWPDD